MLTCIVLSIVVISVLTYQVFYLMRLYSFMNDPPFQTTTTATLFHLSLGFYNVVFVNLSMDPQNDLSLNLHLTPEAPTTKLLLHDFAFGGSPRPRFVCLSPFATGTDFLTFVVVLVGVLVGVFVGVFKRVFAGVSVFALGGLPRPRFTGGYGGLSTSSSSSSSSTWT